MTSKPNRARAITYENFIKAVKVYRNLDLIKAFTRLPTEWADKDTKFEQWRILSPWAAMSIIQESILRSNMQRPERKISEENLKTLGLVYNTVYEKQPRNDPHPALRMLVRISNQQFGFQESDYQEIARTIALFEFMDSQHGVELNNLFISTMGVTPTSYVNSLLFIWSSVRANSGIWSDDLLDTQECSELVDEIGKESIIRAKDTLIISTSEFKRMQENLPYSERKSLSLWKPNPLKRYPLIQVDTDTVIAPISRLILKRATPKGVSLDCVSAHGDVFTRLLGEVVEDYVGAQLKQMRDCEVFSSVRIESKKSSFESIDWFVETSTHVMLFEVKSARMPIAAEMGEEQLLEVMKRNFNKAISQLNATAAMLENDPEFMPHLSRDKPVIGIIVTFDSWYQLNSSLAREFLTDPNLPTLGMSLRELELLTPHSASDVSKKLQKILEDTELQTWSLGLALGGELESTTNPLLEKAVEKLAFFH